MTEPRKPAGGIAAAAITPAGNIMRAVAAADGRVEMSLRNNDLRIPLPLIEQRSTYTETVDTPHGTARVRHTLALAVQREAAQALFNSNFRRRAASDGLVAMITMESGERLLVGRSERLGIEQPLRIAAERMESGSKPLDGTPYILTLESVDADPAAEIKT